VEPERYFRDGERDSYRWYTHETLFIKLIKILARPTFQTFIKLTCKGLDNLPKTGPYIIVSNHISNYDPVFLTAYLPRHIHFMAKHTLYRNFALAWFIRMAGSFPVYRGKNDMWALQQAGRILEAGSVLIMFPEGTRSRNRASLKRGKLGAAKLCLQYQVPLLPVAISGTQAVTLDIRSRNPVHINVGQPLDVASVVSQPPYTHDDARLLTEASMAEIAALLPPENRGVYG